MHHPLWVTVYDNFLVKNIITSKCPNVLDFSLLSSFYCNLCTLMKHKIYWFYTRFMHKIGIAHIKLFTYLFKCIDFWGLEVNMMNWCVRILWNPSKTIRCHSINSFFSVFTKSSITFGPEIILKDFKLCPRQDINQFGLH